MKTEKWLVLSIVLLSIAIAFSGLFIGKSLSVFSKLESQKKVTIEQKGNDDILSFSEAAVYLKITEEKLRFLVEKSNFIDGKGIPYYRIDNSISFSKTALSNWIIYISENQFDY